MADAPVWTLWRDQGRIRVLCTVPRAIAEGKTVTVVPRAERDEARDRAKFFESTSRAYHRALGDIAEFINRSQSDDPMVSEIAAIAQRGFVEAGRASQSDDGNHVDPALPNPAGHPESSHDTGGSDG